MEKTAWIRPKKNSGKMNKPSRNARRTCPSIITRARVVRQLSHAKSTRLPTVAIHALRDPDLIMKKNTTNVVAKKRVR